MSAVLDAARNLADDYPGGCQALGPRIGKPGFSLSHELKGSGTAKLGLLTAVQMTTRTGDLRILNAFAAEAHCMVLPLPEALALDGCQAMAHVANVAAEFNDVVQAFVAAVSDGKVSANELAAIRRQWGELQAAGQHLLAHAEQVHMAGKPREFIEP